MRTQRLNEKLVELGETDALSRWQGVRRFAALTALKHAPEAGFYEGNWWRGPLLYALIRRYRPTHVLEFGTGRGFSALCMAQAAVDAGIDSTIWTLDRIAPTQPQAWPIDTGDGPRLTRASLEEVWQAHIPVAVRQRIRCLTGTTRSAMARWRRECRAPVSMGYIDAGHDYWSVKHDLLAFLRVAEPACTILLDDYTARSGYGVKRLVDEDVAPVVPEAAIEILDSGMEDWVGLGIRARHQMALIAAEGMGPAAHRALQDRLSRGGFRQLYALHETGATIKALGRAAVKPLVEAGRGIP